MSQPLRFSCALLILIGLLAAGRPAVHAQRMPRLLESIQVLEAGGRETVEFRFSSPYDGVPLEEHARGWLSLGFSATGSEVPVRNFRATGSKIIKDIRVVQNKYSTTVSFTLKDSALSLRGKLGFTNEKNLLRVVIGAPGGQPAAGPAEAAEEKSLLSQMTRKIAGESGQRPAAEAPAARAEPAKLGQYEGADWLPTLLTLGVSLAAIIGGLYLVVFLYNRLVGPRFSRLGSGYPIKQISSFHLGPKQRIVVLDINGEIVACGVTASQISFLTRLGGSAAAAQKRGAPARPQKPAPSGDAGETAANPAPEAASGARGAKAQRVAGGGQAEPAAQPPVKPPPGKPEKPAGKADPVQQFAEALKEKVSSLKRIK